MTLTLEEVASTHIQSMKACSEIFKEAAATTPLQDQLSVAKDIADKVRGDAAKFGIMLGENTGDVSVVEVAGMLNSLHQSVAALCVCMHTLTYQAGPTLRDDLKQGATNLIRQCTALIEVVADKSRTAKAVTRAVGGVWDSCDAIKKQALDNKTSMFRRLAACIRAGRDTLREMADLAKEDDETLETVKEKEEEEEEEGDDEPGDDLVDEDQGMAKKEHQGAVAPDQGNHEANGEDVNEDVEFDSEALSAKEKQILEASRQLMELAVQAVQLIAKPLLAAPSLTPEAVEGWESCLWHCKSLQRGLEDLGAALYAPQDAEEIQGASEAISISLECMLDELPEDVTSVISEEQLGSLGARVTIITSKLETLLLAQQEQDCS